MSDISLTGDAEYVHPGPPVELDLDEAAVEKALKIMREEVR